MLGQKFKNCLLTWSPFCLLFMTSMANSRTLPKLTMDTIEKCVPYGTGKMNTRSLIQLCLEMNCLCFSFEPVCLSLLSTIIKQHTTEQGQNKGAKGCEDKTFLFEMLALRIFLNHEWLWKIINDHEWPYKKRIKDHTAWSCRIKQDHLVNICRAKQNYGRSWMIFLIIQDHLGDTG